MRRDEEHEATRRLLELAAELPRSVEPERDLWPGIEERIRAGGDVAEADPVAGAGAGVGGPAAKGAAGWRSGRGQGLLAAAAVLVLFATGYVVGVLKPFGEEGEEGRVALPTDSRTEAVVAAEFRPVADAEWAAADSVLTLLLAEHPGELSPETLALIRTNLAIIDAAIGEIRVALENDPGNPELEQLLTAGYRRRGALMRRTVDCAESI